MKTIIIGFSILVLCTSCSRENGYSVYLIAFEEIAEGKNLAQIREVMFRYNYNYMVPGADLYRFNHDDEQFVRLENEIQTISTPVVIKNPTNLSEIVLYNRDKGTSSSYAISGLRVLQRRESGMCYTLLLLPINTLQPSK